MVSAGARHGCGVRVTLREHPTQHKVVVGLLLGLCEPWILTRSGLNTPQPHTHIHTLILSSPSSRPNPCPPSGGSQPPTTAQAAASQRGPAGQYCFECKTRTSRHTLNHNSFGFHTHPKCQGMCNPEPWCITSPQGHEMDGQTDLCSAASPTGSPDGDQNTCHVS